MLLELDGEGPIHTQLTRALRQVIIDGRAAPGSRLPATRRLARELEVSRNTVLAAYEQLEAEGYVGARQGSGTYVHEELMLPAAVASTTPPGHRSAREVRPHFSERARRLESMTRGSRPRWAPSARKLRYDFRYGPPAFREFPLERFARHLAQQMRHARPRDLDYGDPCGCPQLREALASYLARTRGARCEAEQIILTRGAQQAFGLIARVLLDAGDHVLFEDPGYRGARLSFASAGASLMSARVDGEGFAAGVIANAPRRTRLAYMTPSHQFPLGMTMPLQRRLALVAEAAASGVYLVEDDYEGETRFDGQAIPCLQGIDPAQSVIYVSSLSKALLPALRMGYVIVPPALVDAFAREKAVMDAGGVTPMERAAAEFIRSGDLERYTLRASKQNQRRREALLDGVQKHLRGVARLEGTGAGLHATLWLPDVPAHQTRPLRSEAAKADVGIYPITPFYEEFEPPSAGYLMGYATLSPEQIIAGLRRLGTAAANFEAVQ